MGTSCSTFSNTFYSLIHQATRMDIAVGYITADSIAELKQTILYNTNIETLNLIIGMHRWDKFTKLEYNAAIELNDYLRSECRGEVRLVLPFRFHGKLYSYSNNNGAFAVIIGSNNLSSIVESRTRTYEASVLLQDENYTGQMRDFIEKLNVNATDNIANVQISEFKAYNLLLEDHENVEQVSPDQLADCISSLTNIRFEIPLIKKEKVPEHSNLNAFFGKGRKVPGKGTIQPRHWYETELIVPNTITTVPDYPQKNTPTAIFNVITDDGWKFSCKVSGDYSKNLRSEDDLKILGKWIKGRLENNGVLDVGHLVTPNTLKNYGRDNITLTKTTIENLWYLDFGVR
jgi:DNA polymerase III, alpha subunit (gram-positive type)